MTSPSTRPGWNTCFSYPLNTDGYRTGHRPQDLIHFTWGISLDTDGCRKTMKTPHCFRSAWVTWCCLPPSCRGCLRHHEPCQSWNRKGSCLPWTHVTTRKMEEKITLRLSKPKVGDRNCDKISYNELLYNFCRKIRRLLKTSLFTGHKTEEWFICYVCKG